MSNGCSVREEIFGELWTFDAMDWRARPGKDCPSVCPRVTVIVPTFNRSRPLHGFLASLLAQTYREWELVVIDDSADPEWRKDGDPTNTLFRVISGNGHRVRVAKTVKAGIPGGYNLGLDLCETPMAVRQEDDQVLECRYLETLVGHFDHLSEHAPDHMRRRDIGAVAGCALNPNARMSMGTTWNPQALKNIFFWGAGMDGNVGLMADDDQQTPIVAPGQAYQVGVLHGMWLFDVAAMRDVGGFSRVTSILGHREETEASLRLSWGGYSMWVVPDAISYHLAAPGGSRTSVDATYRHLKCRDEKTFQRWLADGISEGKPVPMEVQSQKLERILKSRRGTK